MSRDDDDKQAAIKQTLPLGSAPIIKPRDREKESSLVSSAKLPTLPPSASASGMVTLSGNRLPEALAREIINRRFAQAGYQMEPDFPFAHGDTLVTLDGFDPQNRIGFQYISHADQDVVTDHDLATSAALKRIESAGGARVLVIHDGEAPTGDDLMAIVDEFLRRSR